MAVRPVPAFFSAGHRPPQDAALQGILPVCFHVPLPMVAGHVAVAPAADCVPGRRDTARGGMPLAGLLPGPGQKGVGLVVFRPIQQAGHGKDQQGEADAQDHLQGRLLLPEGGQGHP